MALNSSLLKNLGAASLAGLIIVLTPFANAAELSEGNLLAIRNALAQLKIDHRQFSDGEIESLLKDGLELRDLDSNRESMRLQQDSLITCHSTKCHTHPF